MPWQDPGAALLLNIDWHCLHGGLGAPALQIIFPAAGSARVPPRSQHSPRVGQGAQQAEERCTASSWPGAAPGPLLCWCMVLSRADSGEGKEEVLGLSEWGCEVGKGAGWHLQLGPEVEVASRPCFLGMRGTRGGGVILAQLLHICLVRVPLLPNLSGRAGSGIVPGTGPASWMLVPSLVSSESDSPCRSPGPLPAGKDEMGPESI